jgi:hypothetical protein
MTARECHPAANHERAPVRKLDVCLTPFGAFLRSFSNGTHDLRIPIQQPQRFRMATAKSRTRSRAGEDCGPRCGWRKKEARF